MGTQRRKPGTFFQVDNVLLDKFGKQLGAYGLVVYMALSRYRNSTTQECFPSKELLAEETGISVRSVHNALRQLERLGVIKTTGRKGRASLYTLPVLSVDAPTSARPADPSASYADRTKEKLTKRITPSPQTSTKISRVEFVVIE